jgi:glycerophosphoryl diester phosphodiesterase
MLGLSATKIQGEYELFFNLGIDGVFSDYPDTAISVCCNIK